MFQLTLCTVSQQSEKNRKRHIISTDISDEGEGRLRASVDFLLPVILLRGESTDPGLAGISSSCSAAAFEPVCISNTARAALSLLTQDCRECTTGTDFNEDTGDEGFDDTDESGDLGSCADFLVDGCVAFGFFVYQQKHCTDTIYRNRTRLFTTLANTGNQNEHF